MAKQMNNQSDHELSMVEQHAMSRLGKVEEEKEEQYQKQPTNFKMMTVIMPILLLIALLGMIGPMLFRMIF